MFLTGQVFKLHYFKMSSKLASFFKFGFRFVKSKKTSYEFVLNMFWR